MIAAHLFYLAEPLLFDSNNIVFVIVGEGFKGIFSYTLACHTSFKLTQQSQKREKLGLLEGVKVIIFNPTDIQSNGFQQDSDEVSWNQNIIQTFIWQDLLILADISFTHLLVSRTKGDLVVFMHFCVPHHPPLALTKKKKFTGPSTLFSFNLQFLIRVQKLTDRSFEKMLLACQRRWSAISEQNDWFLKVDVWRWKRNIYPSGREAALIKHYRKWLAISYSPESFPPSLSYMFKCCSLSISIPKACELTTGRKVGYLCKLSHLKVMSVRWWHNVCVGVSFCSMISFLLKDL